MGSIDYASTAAPTPEGALERTHRRRAAAMAQPLISERVAAPLREVLIEAGQWRRVPAGQPLFEQGEHCETMWLLLEGSVCLGHHDSQGEWRQFRLAESGEWMGCAACWLRESHNLRAVAAVDVLAVGMSRAQIDAWAAEDPAAWRAAMESVVDALAELQLQQTRQAVRRESLDALGRVSEWLLDMWRRQGSTVRFIQRKKYVASQLAITPETFSRCLRQLEEEQCISGAGYELQILAPDLLRQKARPRCEDKAAAARAGA